MPAYPDVYAADDWDFNTAATGTAKISGVIVIIPNNGYNWDIGTAPTGAACGGASAPYDSGYTLINSGGMIGLIWVPDSTDPANWVTSFGLCATLRNRMYASSGTCSSDVDCVVAYVSQKNTFNEAA